MCFSANASFASSAIIAVVGVATLARAPDRRDWLFAGLPLLFAWHQFNEGMVWLGLTGDVPIGSLQGWGFAYMLYAHGLLPLLIPLSAWLLEPNRHRQRLILPFLLIGGGLTLYQLWALLSFSTDIFVREHSVVYHNPATRRRLVALLYIVATCGALFFSGYRYIVWFGVANLVGLLVVVYLKQYAFTSVWCTYAAIVSVLIYGHFHLRRRREAKAG